MCITLGVWVVVKKTKSGRIETMWQGKTQSGAWQENDEFGKGDSIMTKNKYDDKTFYTTGEV